MPKRDILKTLRAFQRAVTAKPTNPILRQSLAHYLIELGHTEQAIQELDICVKLFAARGKLLAAIACTKRLLELDPSRTDLLLFLTRNYAKRGAQRVAQPVEEPDTVDLPVLTLDEDLGDSGELDLDLLPEPMPIAAPAYQRVDVVQPLLIERTELPHIPLFSSLPPETFMTLLEHLELMQVPANTSLFVEEGEALPPEGPALHILVSGAVEAWRSGVRLDTLGPGDFFGEFAMLTGRNSGARLVTSAASEILLLRPQTLEQLTEVYPSIRAELERFYQRRLLTSLLNTNALFSGLDDDARAAIADAFHVAHFPPNTHLITRGSPNPNLYLVLFGEVRLRTRSEERVLGPGALLGALSAATARPYGNDVWTHTRCRLYELPRDALREQLSGRALTRDVLADLHDHLILPYEGA